MPSGFESPEVKEQRIQAGVKRLTPSATRKDVHAFADGVRAIQRKHGADVADEAMRRVIASNPELCTLMLNVIDAIAAPEIKGEFNAKAIEIVVEVLEDAGLRVEDHIRVTDNGIGLTKEAVSAIAATGFNEIQQFGEGNDTLKGMGIDRSEGFVHPLSDTMPADPKNGIPDDSINLWGCVSIFTSVAMGWMEGNKDNSMAMLRECVAIASPTTNLELLMSRSRYDDRALMRLCALAHSGLEIKAQQATGG